jgi:NADH:ubiquinone oxidoreductase subunit E
MKYLIRICGGIMCKNNFSDDLFKEIKKIIGDNMGVSIEKRSCMSLCSSAPNMEIINNETGETTIRRDLDFNNINGIIKPLLKG